MGGRGAVALLLVLFFGLSMAAPAEAQTAPWFNSSYHYRLKVWVQNNNTARFDWPVEVSLNFTDLFRQAGCTSPCTFDTNSVRVVEYNNASGTLTIKEERPSQFDPDFDMLDNGTYDNATNAVGTVTWILNGSGAATGHRTFFIYFDTREAAGERTFPGIAPKEPPSYPSPFTITTTQKRFSVNTSGVNATVDTDKGLNTSGIVNITLKPFAGDPFSDLIVSEGASTDPTAGYISMFNNSSGEYTGANFSGNYTIYRGPVRTVVVQRGNESLFGNRSNETCLSCKGNFTQRYYFYANLTWFRTEVVYRAPPNTTKGSPDNCPATATNCAPSILNFSLSSSNGFGSPTEWTTAESGDYSLACITGANGNYLGVFTTSDTDFEADSWMVSSSKVAGTRGLVGAHVNNRRLSAADIPVRVRADIIPTFLAPSDCRTGTLAGQGEHPGNLWLNETSPPNVTAASPELWRVNLTARTEYGGVGANVTAFNRGEALNVTGLITADTHLLNNSAGPQNATLANATGSQELSLVKINDNNWSRSYTLATDADVSAPWTASLRINDSAGRLLNRSNSSFRVVDIYWVNVTNLTNYGSNPTNASGYVLLVNGSPASFTASVHNYRWAPHINQPGTYGITGLDWRDLDCTFEDIDAPASRANATLASNDSAGNYTLNFVSNTTLRPWNLSCFVKGSGPHTRGNYGNNTTLRYLTEPRGTNVGTALNATAATVMNVTGSQDNSTTVTVTINNSGSGHAFDVNLSVGNLPAGWGVDVNGTPLSAPYSVFSAASMNNTTSNRTRDFEVRVRVATNASPGTYPIHFNTIWKNLEEKTWGNQTWTEGRTNNTSATLSVTVTSTPLMALNTTRVVLGNVSPNSTTLFAGAFLLNNTGNDWLNNTVFTLNLSNFSAGIAVTFSKNGSNIPPNNTFVAGNGSVDVTVSVPKNAPAGNYEGRFYVNATGSFANCASTPFGNCNATLNVSFSVSQNRSWTTYDLTFNNSTNANRTLAGNIMDVRSGDTNFSLGFLNISSEANFNLTFNISKVEEAGRTFVNRSAGNGSLNYLFDIHANDAQTFQNLTLNYTIPPTFAGTSWVNITVNASVRGCAEPPAADCTATHIVTQTRQVSFNFTLRVADPSPPDIFNVSVNGATGASSISGLVFNASRDTATIAANVTDTGTGVRDVWANISLPNGSWDNSTQLLPVSGTTGLYRANFAVPALNGTYTFFITAFDLNVTSNCAVNNSSATGACAPFPAGGFKFNATNTTDGRLEESPLTFQADDVTYPSGQSFNLSTTFRNTGPGSAYNVWLNLSIDQNNTTALAVNGTAFGNQSCGDVTPGASCTRFFNVTVRPQAVNGTYAVNATLYWSNPNGSINTSVANSTVIHVWANPVLNLTTGANATVEGRVVNITVDHNTSNASVALRVFDNGNAALANVTWNMTGANASGSTITFALNVSGFGTYPGASVGPGTFRDVLLNVSVPDKHVNGTWEFRFEANASGSACVSALRCGKSFNLSVTVPLSRNWTLNDSTGINLTCGLSTNRVPVDSVSVPCVVRVNNTANRDLNFTLSPPNQTLGGSGNLSVNVTRFVISRFGAPVFFSVSVNTTGVAPGQYNLSFRVNATDNGTGDAGTPLQRNLTVNITVFTKPALVLLNASTATATNFSEAGKQVLVVEQGENVDIRVNATDASGSANIGIRQVQAEVARPNGTSYTNVSTDCLVNCTFTANNNSTWRILIPGANFTLRGNHTASLIAVDNQSSPSDSVNLTLRVKPRLQPVVNTSKTAGGTPTTDFGPNDNVFWNIYVPDLLGAPVASTNVTVTFRDPANDPVDCSAANISAGTTDAAGSVQLRCKLSASATTGTYTWNVSYNYTDASNNTTSLNFTTGTLTVKAADLFVTASAGGPWKPGDVMTVTVSTKDQNLQTLGVGGVTVRVELYYPNSTLYLVNSSPVFLAGPELWSAALTLGSDIPFGSVGSANSTYFVKAVANKTGSNITVNDSKVVYITDTLTATLSVGTPQFNNSTMNATFVVFRSGNVLVDPDSFVFNVTTADDAPLVGGNCAAPLNVDNLSSLPANVQRLGTGYFLIQCQLQAAQPQGFYKANLTVRRKGITAGDMRAFELALSSLDVNIDVLSQSISNLAFRATIVNPGATGPSDVTVEYQVTLNLNPTVAAGTQACQIRPFSTTVCPTISVVLPGAGDYNIRITVYGPGVQPVTVTRGPITIGAAPGPAPGPAGGPTGGGAGGGGGAAGQGEADRAVLKITAPREIDAVRGYRLNYTFTVANAGNLYVPSTAIHLQGIPRSWWSVAPEDGLPSLGILQTKQFVLTLSIPPDVERGRLFLTLSAEGGGARDEVPILLTIYGDWTELIPETLRRLNDTLSELRQRTREVEATGVNVSAAMPLLEEGDRLLQQAREAYLNRDYNAAAALLEKARVALDRANAFLAAAPTVQAVPVTPQAVLLAIVAVLAASAFGVAVWTGQIARSLTRTARGLVLGTGTRPAVAGPPPRGAEAPPPATPPSAGVPRPPPADALAERMARTRESTERLVKSLEEQMRKGLISKQRYEELVRKIRR